MGLEGNTRIESGQEPLAALGWVRDHDRDVTETPLWDEFYNEPNLLVRLRILESYCARKPGDPANCLRSGRTCEPATLRALTVVAYLRGDLELQGLPPVAERWTFGRIAAWVADSLDNKRIPGSGWTRFATEDDARKSYSKLRGSEFEIRKAPEDVQALLNALILLLVSTVTEKVGFRGRTR